MAQPTDYVVYYPFNSNANDESNDNLHGTVSGATLVSDRYEMSETAYYFDGVDDYIDIGQTQNLGITDQMTVSAWVKLDNDAESYPLLSSLVDGGLSSGSMDFTWHRIQQQLAIQLHQDETNYISYLANSNTSLENGVFHHVVFTYDEERDELQKIHIYVDNQELETQLYDAHPDHTNDGSGDILQTTNTIHIGGRPGNVFPRFTKGVIDDVRIYDRALSEDEISELYTEGSPPTISFFTPGSGPIGSSVVISGTNFDLTPSNNIVYFGATKATVTSATSTSLTVTVPAGATYQPLTVFVDGLMASSSSPFIVTFDGHNLISASSLDSKKDLSTGSRPYAFTSGDLNGDGRVDLAVTNQEDNTVSIFRNSSEVGFIQFVADPNLTTGTYPYSIVAGDLDGDAKLDLVVPNQDSNTLSVFRNNGIGAITFDSKVDLATDLAPGYIALGDIDGDGRLDIVTTHFTSSTVMLFRNTGLGPGEISFASGITIPMSGPTSAVALADLDSDGKIDLVVCDHLNTLVSVFRNISTGVGDLNFDTKVDYATGANPISVAIGDLNNDNKLDLAIANESGYSVSVFSNTSEGTGHISFANKSDYDTDSAPESVAIGDLNGDGKVDLVTSNWESEKISMFKNTSTNAGSISYSPKVDRNTGKETRDVGIADLDGDGRSEVIAVNGGSNTLSIFRNIVRLTTPEPGTDFLSFSLTEQNSVATIDAVNHKIKVEVKSGTDVTSLVANFVLSNEAIARVDRAVQVSGTSINDFTYPVNYKVTEGDEGPAQLWQVIVTVDDHPEILSVTAADSYILGSGGYAVSATITDNTEVAGVKAYVKKTAEANYTAIDAQSTEGNSYSWSFQNSSFDGLGLTFYIEAKDTEDNITNSELFWSRTVLSDAEPIPDLVSSKDQLDYSLIAIPYQSQGVESVFTNLGNYNNSQWKLAHYDGGFNYQFCPKDFDYFEPGKGYWFLTSRSVDFRLNGGQAVHANEVEPYLLQLRGEDWNMIGNPYLFDMDWQEVIDHNSDNGISVEKLVTYKDRQYNSDQTEFDKYDGALLYSSTDVEIEIPVTAIRSSGSRTAKANRTNDLQYFGSGPWGLALGLRNETMEYHVSGIAMKEGAKKGKDAYDWKMLPRLSSYLDISFSEAITKSAVPIDDEYTWEFTVNSNLLGEHTTLSWDHRDLKESDYGLVLLDVKNQKVVDMSRRNYYSFEMQVEKHPFRLFYARKDKLSAYVSTSAGFVGDPFPNPGSGVFILPLVSDNDSAVGIKVYDILGKEVSTYQQNLSTGYHEIKIDLAEKVSNLKAGTYLMQVTFLSGQGIQKINKRIVYK